MENNRKRIDEIDLMMLQLFELRMDLVKNIKEFKRENNLPILDENRQKEIIEKNGSIVRKEYQKYYVDFITNLMRISREYQENE